MDAIVTNPAITESGLATLPDLVAFAARALKPSGLLAVLSNPEYLPQFFDGLKNSDLLWVGGSYGCHLSQGVADHAGQTSYVSPVQVASHVWEVPVAASRRWRHNRGSGA